VPRARDSRLNACICRDRGPEPEASAPQTGVQLHLVARVTPSLQLQDQLFSGDLDWFLGGDSLQLFPAVQLRPAGRQEQQELNRILGICVPARGTACHPVLLLQILNAQRNVLSREIQRVGQLLRPRSTVAELPEDAELVVVPVTGLHVSAFYHFEVDWVTTPFGFLSRGLRLVVEGLVRARPATVPPVPPKPSPGVARGQRSCSRRPQLLGARPPLCRLSAAHGSA
jgi:hypothetical protein